ncbi:MAG TPA: hypothetical protein VIY52_28180 [Streptosporangiaceae bacterium]
MTDGDDWRVTVSLVGQAQVEQAQRALSEHEVEEDVRRQLGRTIAVGAGDSQIFLYAGTEIAAMEAERVAREVLAQRGIQAEFALHRWHPIEEQWESPDVAMPQTEAERQAEHQRLEDSEAAESVAAGFGRWQARVEFPSHREAVALARKLEGEGRAVVRRWKFLIVGADNEDDVRKLAGQIRQEAPPDAVIRIEEPDVGGPFIPS